MRNSLMTMALFGMLSACSSAPKVKTLSGNEQITADQNLIKVELGYFGPKDSIDLTFENVSDKKNSNYVFQVSQLSEKMHLKLPPGKYRLSKIDYVQRVPFHASQPMEFDVKNEGEQSWGELFTSCSYWENSTRLHEFRLRVEQHQFMKVTQYGPCLVFLAKN